MLIYLRGNEIIAYNRIVNKVEAVPYLSDTCLWIERLIIDVPECNNNEEVKLYLNEDKTIRYEIEKIDDQSTEVVHSSSETKEILNTEAFRMLDEKLNKVLQLLEDITINN